MFPINVFVIFSGQNIWILILDDRKVNCFHIYDKFFCLFFNQKNLSWCINARVQFANKSFQAWKILSDMKFIPVFTGWKWIANNVNVSQNLD